MTDRKVSALVPLLSSDALVGASVDGCPSASSSGLEPLELVDELELLEVLVELSWLRWLDEFSWVTLRTDSG